MGRIDMEHFSLPLLEWYDKNKRDMVWRDRMNPYYTWISEIMLQQTRTTAAKEYFVRFVEELPDVLSLADVSEERLMKMWEGLGYYNRARNLKKAAGIIVEKYDGELPADVSKLRELPGIGPYTAGAIASIAYGIKAPAVDGNVLRVVMRFLKCGEDISKIPVRRKVEMMLMQAMPERPGDFNQAVMELGEVVCIPNGTPLCQKCPLYPDCEARKFGCQEKYPVKPEKKARRIEKRTILIFESDEKIGICRRPEKGLLAGLYEFPSVEGSRTVQRLKEDLRLQGIEADEVKSLGNATHVFSHVEWHMKGIYIKLARSTEIKKLSSDMVFVAMDELTGKYTLPVAFHYYLKKYKG